jgi:hypothetical protein
MDHRRRPSGARAHFYGLYILRYTFRPATPTKRADLDVNFAVVVDEKYWANRQGTAEMRWGARGS